MNVSQDAIETQSESSKRGRNDNYISRLRAYDKHYLEKSSLV